MNAKIKEPDRTQGGTFIRDREGNLLEHIPPTAPRTVKPGDSILPAASATAKPVVKKGKE